MTPRVLPRGTVAFAFTDVEGSTGHLRRSGAGWAAVLSTVHALVRAAAEDAGGVVVDNEGDGAFLAFPDVRSAVAGLVGAQVALLARPWPGDVPVRVRAAVHAGEAEPVDGRYVALAVHEAARIGALAHGGQVLISEHAALLLRGQLPEGVLLRDRGRYRVRDFPLPVRLHDVTAPGLPPVERPPRAVPADGGNLPPAATPVHGRDDLLTRLAPAAPLTTLVGPPGVGKSTVAVAAARASAAVDGVWLVALETLPAVRSAASAVLATLGLPPSGGDDALAGQLAGRDLVLVLDGADDRLAEVAALAAALAGGAPSVRLLVTARRPLRLAGERVVRIGPLALPGEDASPEAVLAAPAVRVLLAGEGARFDDPVHADALGTLARRADGLPLALELVGARLALLTPGELLGRVDAQLARAGRSGVLRAALDSAWTSLPEPARRLWARLSVCAAPVDLDAVEHICADDADLPEDEVLDALDALTTSSVVLPEPADDGRTRYRLLRSVRSYGRERLEEAGEAGPLADRHARWVGAAVEEWLRRVDAEPPPGALRELAAAQDDVLVGLAHLGTTEPGRVLAVLLPLRRHLRESLDLADLLALAEGLPPVRGAEAVVTLLRGQLSWERTPGPGTIPLLRRAAALDAPDGIRADVLVQLVLALEQFDLDPDLAGEEELARAAAGAGDPGLLVRATALRAHGGSPADLELLDRAVDLARAEAPGLVLWATGRRLHLWSGARPERAEADVETLLLGLPLAGASESTAGLLMAALALLGLGRHDQAGRLAARAEVAAVRRRNVVMAWAGSLMRACAAGGLRDPDAPGLLDAAAASPVARLGAGNAAMVEIARGWVLAGSDRAAAQRWALTVDADGGLVDWHLRALAAAVQDPGWRPEHGLLGHLRPPAT